MFICMSYDLMWVSPVYDTSSVTFPLDQHLDSETKCITRI